MPFTEINVSDDRAAQQAMKERVGALAVPTLLVGEKVMSGYMRSLLDGELTAAGYPPAAGAPAAAGPAAGANADAGEDAGETEAAPDAEPATGEDDPGR